VIDRSGVVTPATGFGPESQADRGVPDGPFVRADLLGSQVSTESAELLDSVELESAELLDSAELLHPAESFEQFFARHQHELARLAFLMIGERDEADDIAADALVAAWRAWDRVQSMDRPAAYVRRVVVNMAISRRRTRVRDRRRFHLLAARAPVHEAAVDSAATVDVRAALATLPAGRRACVVLRYAFDLSEQEVAATLQISVGTVKSQTSKAAAQLRGVLEQLVSGDQEEGR
jgi:RNA polymerase sigma-70 factor (sigma-E family)